MQHHIEQDETTTEQDRVPIAKGLRHVDPLARISRFFRPAAPATAGELPAAYDLDDEAQQTTAEFVAIDLRGGDAYGAPFPPALFGGYDRETVDARIAELEGELAELRAQTDPDNVVETEIQHLGDETAEILRVAHGKADAMVKKAQADAAATIAAAEDRAAVIVTDAEDRVRRLDRDTDLLWAERAKLIEDTRRLGEQLVRVADQAAERFPPEDEAPDGTGVPAS